LHFLQHANEMTAAATTDEEEAWLCSVADAAEVQWRRDQEYRRESCLVKVISGGQTGADWAALEAARDLGIPTGGVAPAFPSSARRDAELAQRFGLSFLPVDGTSRAAFATAHARRTQLNVRIADATLAFRLCPSIGTDRTIAYAATGRWGPFSGPTPDPPHRPCLVLTNVGGEPFTGDHPAVRAIRDFVIRHSVRILNVAGHRDDARAQLPGFTAAVHRLLRVALEPLRKPGTRGPGTE
jgi:hypothetical protein